MLHSGDDKGNGRQLAEVCREFREGTIQAGRNIGEVDPRVMLARIAGLEIIWTGITDRGQTFGVACKRIAAAISWDARFGELKRNFGLLSPLTP